MFIKRIHYHSHHYATNLIWTRMDFYYLDEFQNFITPSMSTILSGSSKYGLGLILAHQDMEQISKYDSELANSVISNPGTRICFRVGDNDARKLESGFASFDSMDLLNLHTGEAICKIDTASQDFNLLTHRLPEVGLEVKEQNIRHCIHNSRNRYGKPKKEVEEYIYGMYALANNPEKEVSKDRPRTGTQDTQILDTPAGTDNVIVIDNVTSDAINNQSTDIDVKAKEYLEQVKERERTREHKYLQNLIKKMVESKGFKAVIEEPVNNGEGRIDVGLSKDELKIAVEISVTNTIGNEVQNVHKCIAAGYQTVIMCCDNVRHLASIKEMMLAQVGESSSHQDVKFFSTIELFSYLDSLIPTHEKQEEKRIKGYRVKVTYKK
jgi:hypothetical protein